MRLQRHVWITALMVGCLFIAAFGFAQAWRGRGRMTGKVVDQDGNPIPDVTVKLFHVKTESGFETKTNAKGEWKASFIRGGTWYIDFEKTGYAPKKISVNIKELGKNPPIEIVMEKLQAPGIPPELLDDVDRGNRLLEEGKYDEAIAVFQKLIEQYPHLTVLNANIADAYARKGDYTAALEHYQKALEEHPNPAQVWMAIGDIYIKMRQFEKATEAFSHVELDKIDDPNLLYNLGNAYFAVQKMDPAIAAFERAVQLQPDFADAWYMLGTLYLGKNDKANARRAYERYLELDSTSQRAEEVRMILRGLRP